VAISVLGVTRRTLTIWQKIEGSPKPLSNGQWPVAGWRECARLRGPKGGKTPVGNEEALKARMLLAEVDEPGLRIEVKTQPLPQPNPGCQRMRKKYCGSGSRTYAHSR
jgi:hypothetical protein